MTPPLSTTSGRDPETTPMGTVSKRRITKRPGQHRSTPHGDQSSKFGMQHERIIAFTFPGRQPIYEGVVCLLCGAPIRWLPLRGPSAGTSSCLVPRCSAGCVPPKAEQRQTPTPKRMPDAIRARQYRSFVKEHVR